MSMSSFDLHNEDTRLVTHQNCVYKLKVVFFGIPEIVSASLQDAANCVVEHVFRAVLYAEERDEDISVIETNDFGVFFFKKYWKTSEKLGFKQNGIHLKVHPNVLIFEIFLKEDSHFLSDLQDDVTNKQSKTAESKKLSETQNTGDSEKISSVLKDANESYQAETEQRKSADEGNKRKKDIEDVNKKSKHLKLSEDSQSSESDEHQSSESDEHQSSESDEHQSSESDEHQSSESYEHQSSESDEHQSSESDEHQSSESDEHQSSESDEHQSSESDGHQSSESDEHQSSESDEHQSVKTSPSANRDKLSKMLDSTAKTDSPKIRKSPRLCDRESQNQGGQNKSEITAVNELPHISDHTQSIKSTKQLHISTETSRKPKTISPKQMSLREMRMLNQNNSNSESDEANLLRNDRHLIESEDFVETMKLQTLAGSQSLRRSPRRPRRTGLWDLVENITTPIKKLITGK